VFTFEYKRKCNKKNKFIFMLVVKETTNGKAVVVQIRSTTNNCNNILRITNNNNVKTTLYENKNAINRVLLSYNIGITLSHEANRNAINAW